jgi:DNA-binding NarL/FixJ family response regulator
MTRETILYISDQATCSDPVSVALKAAGYEVVGTKSTMQAIALLFILHPVAGVVLYSREEEQLSCEVARSLRGIRPDVPIVLLCREQSDRVPSCVDARVSTSQPAEELITVVRRLVNPECCGAQSARL